VKNTHIHSVALFWCAVGIALGALATKYIPLPYVVAIGGLIVLLILGHQLSGWYSTKQRAAASFNRQGNVKGQSTTRRKKKKPLPKMQASK
jgi:hypothetical protein